MEFSIITPWSNPMEEPITVEEIMRSEVDPPKSVKDFFQIFYAGSSSNLLWRKERHVNSTSAVIVYPCSGGKL